MLHLEHRDQRRQRLVRRGVAQPELADAVGSAAPHSSRVVEEHRVLLSRSNLSYLDVLERRYQTPSALGRSSAPALAPVAVREHLVF